MGVAVMRNRTTELMLQDDPQGPDTALHRHRSVARSTQMTRHQNADKPSSPDSHIQTCLSRARLPRTPLAGMTHGLQRKTDAEAGQEWRDRGRKKRGDELRQKTKR